ncbi:MAG TPA: methyltransferase domain-containing protein, partial [Acidimicrobiales bacterium]|nr:methyltransferase domain-containing protein [Acidimicrobiales bacterium]
ETSADPRLAIGRTLGGRVLEIGPGHVPFPTHPSASVTFADRPVPGGRDATWPELVGQPHGPDADIEIDLDLEGLAPVAEGAFDAVVAAHVVEHLANPLRAVQEMERVIAPGGRLVLIVPDRRRTFDAVREPTPTRHVLDDFERGTAEVDAEHIHEFCRAIFDQPPIHPDHVRAWYDPSRLDGELLALHRRRTIHVHCWDPQEFAVLLAAAAEGGIVTSVLEDLYFCDDRGAEPGNEFGLVLRRPHHPAERHGAGARLVASWVELVLGRPDHDPRRVGALLAVLLGTVGEEPSLEPAVAALGRALGRFAPPASKRRRALRRAVPG